jgi:hypothetical protein
MNIPQSLPRCFLFLLFCSLLIEGCQHGTTEPSVEFTKIPVSAVGGLDKMDTIAGKVIGVSPEQRIVLYAKSGGRWWIQPFARDPLFTKIQRDSKWKNVTHLGEEYAALLVDPGHSPQQTTELLPARGGALAAVAVVESQTPDPSSRPKLLHFSRLRLVRTRFIKLWLWLDELV